MALATAWDRVGDRLRALNYYERLRPTVTAMLALVAELRQDPGLEDVEPSVSLAALNLKLVHSRRYVMVSRVEDEPRHSVIRRPTTRLPRDQDGQRGSSRNDHRRLY